MENAPGKTTTLVTLAISEEPETNAQKSSSQADPDNIQSEISPNSSLRKSPRLKGKNNRKSQSEEGDVNSNNKPENHEEPEYIQKSNQDSEMEIATPDASDPKNNLSESSATLINQLDSATKNNHLSHLNKSTSAIKDTINSKTKRHRTKSWTTLSASPASDSNFHSDNENTKKKLQNHDKPIIKFQAGSGDSVLNKSKTEEFKVDNINNEIDASNKQIMEASVTPNKPIKLDKSSSETPKPADTSNESNKENVLDVHTESHISSAAEIMFVKSPKEVKTIVFLEDTDSDSENNEKKDEKLIPEGDDQCVPVVYRPTNQESETQSCEIISEVNNQEFRALNNVQENPRVDDSCEPMDIDVTIPENVSVIDSKDNTEQQPSNETPVKETRKSLRKSSQNISKEPENTVSEILDKSKRKSSSQIFTEDLEKSSNENKSTLILSHNKDVSNADIDTSKSPQVLTEFSKSISVTDIAKEVVNKNLSVNYLTSTPVQQKDTMKPELQMNTSVITPSNKSKREFKATKERSKIDISLASKSSINDTSDEDSEHELSEESKERNDFLDSEAKDAGDSYESGDSQNEDEKQYEIENEILEKGETLSSEEELSTDSDYEKDSFIVSSDEEDNELLSGSGDDLDMSDNELTMSARSKKKYDESKKKEQKKASREMYEARHKLDKSEDTKSDTSKSKKKNRLRLDSTVLESGEDNNMPPKKNKRMRLESTFETSDPKSDNEEIGYKKKKSKRLSESVCNASVVNEKEIPINENATEEKDPLLMHVKPELQTPQKELDISTVPFTWRDEIEKVQVDENMSMVKSNDTMDPLQATMAQEESNDISSISENEEIAKNYDSVLNELNKENKRKQVKTSDMSLNLDKKQKKSKEPVMELNLTIAKKTKKKAKDESDPPNEKTVKRVFKKLSKNDDDDDIDSVDLNLLFSDDSNDIEKNSDSGNRTGNAESFLPLKRIEAKTDIRSSTGKLNLT